MGVVSQLELGDRITSESIALGEEHDSARQMLLGSMAKQYFIVEVKEL